MLGVDTDLSPIVPLRENGQSTILCYCIDYACRDGLPSRSDEVKVAFHPVIGPFSEFILRLQDQNKNIARFIELCKNLETLSNFPERVDPKGEIERIESFVYVLQEKMDKIAEQLCSEFDLKMDQD